MYKIDAAEAVAIRAAVEERFGPQNWAQFIAIGSPAFNPVMQQTVVSVVYGVIPNYLYDIGAKVAERKFHMESGCMYDKMYTFSPDPSELPALPPTATPVCIGFNHRISGQGGDAAVENFWDVYFGADTADCQAFFGLPSLVGAFTTLYGVTYRHDTKEVLRVKTYTYDRPVDNANWEQALQIALATDRG